MRYGRKNTGGGTTLADRKNSEGYADPTAYAVLKKLDREEKIRAMDIRRGDMFYINRGGASGNLAGKPAVVVSNDKFNGTSNSVVVVYLTVAPTDDRQTHVSIRSGTRQSYAICESVSSVPVEWVGSRIGQCSDREMTNIEIGLLIALDLTAKDVSVKEPPAYRKPENDLEADKKMAALMDELNAAIACKNDLEKKCVETGVRLADAENEIAHLKEQLRMAAKMYSAMSELALK